jgi:hypothetical protein
VGGVGGGRGLSGARGGARGRTDQHDEDGHHDLEAERFLDLSDYVLALFEARLTLCDVFCSADCAQQVLHDIPSCSPNIGF